MCGGQICEMRSYYPKIVYICGRVCVRGRRVGPDSGVSVSDVRQSGPKRLSSQANDSGGSPGELR